MLTVIWRIDGFHVVDLITEQLSYNTQDFLSAVMDVLLSTIFSETLSNRQLDSDSSFHQGGPQP
jgi:hypothetical protein